MVVLVTLSGDGGTGDTLRPERQGRSLVNSKLFNGSIMG